MQFSDKPKHCHHTKHCNNEGTIFRDCTRGPIYDPRWYCEDHIDEADAKQRDISRRAQLTYQRSKVENLEVALSVEKQILADMKGQTRT